MSWGTCNSGSNNIHFDYPPIMSDGRNYATWKPGAVINDNIRKEEGIQTNWQYRKYLTENADSIIKYNQLEACNDCGACSVRFGMNEEPSNSPFLYKSCSDNRRPFGFETSNLKDEYLSSHNLQSRMVSPSITQAQLLENGFKNAK